MIFESENVNFLGYYKETPKSFCLFVFHLLLEGINLLENFNKSYDPSVGKNVQLTDRSGKEQKEGEIMALLSKYTPNPAFSPHAPKLFHAVSISSLNHYNRSLSNLFYSDLTWLPVVLYKINQIKFILCSQFHNSASVCSEEPIS